MATAAATTTERARDAKHRFLQPGYADVTQAEVAAACAETVDSHRF